MNDRPDMKVEGAARDEGRRLGKRGFLLFCLAQSLSQLGSALSAFAIAIWIYQDTGSVTRLAMFYLAGAVPALIVLPWAGKWVDRFDRRWIILICDGLAGSLSGVLVVLFWMDWIRLWQLLLIIAISTALSQIQYLAYSASISSIVTRDLLARANGMVQTGQSIALLLAPLIAGVLLGRVGVHGVLLADLATMSLALLVWVFLRIPKPVGDPEEEKESKTSLEELLFGYRYIRRHRGFLVLLGLFAVLNLAGGMVQTLFTPLILGFASEKVLGAIVSLVSVGVLAGGLGMSFWGGPRRRMAGIAIFAAAQGAFLVAGGIWPRAVPVAVAGFLFMACSPIIASLSATIWQSKVPAAIQGKVFSVRSLLATSSSPVAFALAGPLADRVFEPLMAEGGAWAGTVGRWIGVGKGRGIGLQFIALGLMVLVAVALAWRSRALRGLEEDIPDAPRTAEEEVGEIRLAET